MIKITLDRQFEDKKTGKIGGAKFFSIEPEGGGQYDGFSFGAKKARLLLAALKEHGPDVFQIMLEDYIGTQEGDSKPVATTPAPTLAAAIPAPAPAPAPVLAMPPAPKPETPAAPAKKPRAKSLAKAASPPPEPAATPEPFEPRVFGRTMFNGHAVTLYMDGTWKMSPVASIVTA